MSGDLLPLPGVFQFRNIRKVFRHQLFKELLAVIVAQGKVTVVSAGRLNAEVVHDLLLAGVNAYLIHPHLPDNLAIDHDFLFLRRRGVRYIRTVRALYRKHRVKFIWVKGHANIPENERCDQLAVAAYKAPNLQIDEYYEAEQNSDEQLFSE